MPAHPKFRILLEEEFKEHDAKTTQYNAERSSLQNWQLVKPRLRPWEGAYARLTEKISRMLVLSTEAEKDPDKWREILKEISVYCKIVRILFDEDFQYKIFDSIEKEETKLKSIAK